MHLGGAGGVRGGGDEEINSYDFPLQEKKNYSGNKPNGIKSARGGVFQNIFTKELLVRQRRLKGRKI